MGQIKLNEMEFYAFHGCYNEERMVGNNFLVDISMDTDMEKASRSDNLHDALNYAQVYDIEGRNGNQVIFA
jgi:dihydroneopterin aldolase